MILESQGIKTHHEETKPKEGNEIHNELAHVRLQLSWEPKTICHSTHGCKDEVIQIPKARSCELECPKSDVIEGLVVKDHAFVCIFQQVNRKSAIVGLYYSVRHLGGEEHTKCVNHSIWVLLLDLGYQQYSHCRACVAT